MGNDNMGIKNINKKAHGIYIVTEFIAKFRNWL